MARTTIRDNVAIGEPDLTTAVSPSSNGSNTNGYSVSNAGAWSTSGDGRSFRFAYDGGSALVAGALYQSPAQVSGDEDLTSTGNAVGDTLVVLGSSLTIAANALAGGFLVVRSGVGAGSYYSIQSNLACSSAACSITLEDPIRVATNSSSVIDVYPSNPYYGIVLNPTTATSAPVGVAIVSTTGTQFAWIQVGGAAAVQNDNAATINPGDLVGASITTAGQVSKMTFSGTTALLVPVGVALETISGTNYGMVKLNLD